MSRFNGPEKFDVVGHLKWLQETTSDEIPSQIIHSDDIDNRYKVRKNIWTGVCADLELGIEQNDFTDPDLLAEISSFQEKYCNPEFGKPNRLTLPEDIANLNALIDKITKFQL